MKNIIKNYFDKSSKVIQTLSEYNQDLENIVKEILSCREKRKKILVAGNGGSSADSDHFVGELTCTFSDRDRSAFSAISLSSLPSAITAWSNDFGYDSFFKRQITALGETDDILLLLSTGGGDKKTNASMNLVYAAEEAKKKKMKVISLVGKTGGILYKTSDISILVKSNETSLIQESHMSILHCICVCLDKLMKKN
jgi:D-sedoheptulose 7-phosphate isomerase